MPEGVANPFLSWLLYRAHLSCNFCVTPESLCNSDGRQSDIRADLSSECMSLASKEESLSSLQAFYHTISDLSPPQSKNKAEGWVDPLLNICAQVLTSTVSQRMDKSLGLHEIKCRLP